MSTDQAAATATSFESLEVDVGEDLDAIYDRYYESQWTDGLPIVPPTPARVEALLATTPLAPDTLLGVMPTRWRPTFVHHVAVNAVMAGCRPEYFPLVVGAIEGILSAEFNLYGVQGTTNPAGVMVLVNGPAAIACDVNSGFNLFGPGWRANATIGRAVRLCMWNIGGGLPGLGDMSTLGNPNKYGSCIAENEANSPWQPFHVDRGFAPGESAVTVIATAAPQNVITLTAEPVPILDDLAHAILVPGSNCSFFDHHPGVVMGPVQAGHVASAGYSKEDVQRYLWEHGRRKIEGYSAKDTRAMREWKAACLREENGEEILYPTREPSDIGVIVAGGTNGPHSAVLPTFNGTKMVTKKVQSLVSY